MVGVLILTHGCLGQEILAAATKISGGLPRVTALCLNWDEDLDAARTRVGAALAALDVGGGVVVLTDIYGGTPTRVAQSFEAAGQVEVVTGVNLAMVVKLGCLIAEPANAAALAEMLVRKGRQSIRSTAANEVPTGPMSPCQET